MAAELKCTCTPDWNIAGTRQEVIEQRLAQTLGMTIHEVHVLLDLLDRTLDKVMDIPDDERDEDHGETARIMAAESGHTEGWIKNFLESWEFTTDEVERESHQSWGELGPMGTDSRLKSSAVDHEAR